MSVQDWCTVYTKRTIDSEIIWTHPTVPLGDEPQVEAHFRLFGDSAKLDLLGGVGHVESCFSPFGDGVSVSVT